MRSSTLWGSSSGTLASTVAHDERGEVVGSHVDERALEGPTDRGATGGDDDGFGHGFLLVTAR
jgi:hypothetical protein